LEVVVVLIETVLAATNGSRKEPVSFSIPDEEWQQFLRFLNYSDALRSTRFVREGQGGHIGFRWESGSPVRVHQKEIDEEPVWAMLLKLRPFVLQNEPSYVPSTINGLKRHIRHKAFQRHLNELRDGFLLNTLRGKLQVKGPARSPLSYEVVMDWLNSYQYHLDDSKRKAVVTDLGALGDSQDGLSTILLGLVDMVQASLGTGDFIETLRRCAEGTMPVIHCPPDYFDSVKPL
jgi:hypothetical protein